MIETSEVFLINRSSPNAKPKVCFATVDTAKLQWYSLTSKHSGKLQPQLVENKFGINYLNHPLPHQENKQLAFKGCERQMLFSVKDFFVNDKCVNVPTNIFLKKDKKCDTPYTCFHAQDVCPELNAKYVTINQLKIAEKNINEKLELDVIHVLNLLDIFNQQHNSPELVR